MNKLTFVFIICYIKLSTMMLFSTTNKHVKILSLADYNKSRISFENVAPLTIRTIKAFERSESKHIFQFSCYFPKKEARTAIGVSYSDNEAFYSLYMVLPITHIYTYILSLSFHVHITSNVHSLIIFLLRLLTFAKKINISVMVALDLYIHFVALLKSAIL